MSVENLLVKQKVINKKCIFLNMCKNLKHYSFKYIGSNILYNIH